MCNQILRVDCTLYTFRTLQLKVHSFWVGVWEREVVHPFAYTPIRTHTPTKTHTFTHAHIPPPTLIFIFPVPKTRNTLHMKMSACTLLYIHTNVRLFHSFIHSSHHLFISINVLHREQQHENLLSFSFMHISTYNAVRSEEQNFYLYSIKI